MKKPLSLKFIIGLSIFQLFVDILFIAFTIYLVVATMPNEIMEGVKSGYLQALGYEPDKVTDFELGEIIGHVLCFAIFPILMIIFAYCRKLTAMQVTACIQIAAYLGQLTLPVIPIIILILALQNSVKEYCSLSKEKLPKE